MRTTLRKTVNSGTVFNTFELWQQEYNGISDTNVDFKIWWKMGKLIDEMALDSIENQKNGKEYWQMTAIITEERFMKIKKYAAF